MSLFQFFSYEDGDIHVFYNANRRKGATFFGDQGKGYKTLCLNENYSNFAFI